LKTLHNRLMFTISSIFIISILMTSPLALAEPKLPEDIPEVSKAPFKTQIIKHGNLIAYVKPLYTTYGNPVDYITAPGTYDGVAKLILTLNTKPFPITVGCSGALISNTHILTAAHCVTSDKNAKLILKEGTAYFEGNSISISLDASQTVVHPGWTYDILKGNDVAILKLSSPVTGLTVYGLDSDSTDDLTVHEKVGYGRSGTGNDGDVLPFGIKRNGQNLYDAVADTMLDALGTQGYVPGSVLQYDFDNGLAANDAFGFFFGLGNPGLEVLEVNSAPGDSGGPTFTGDMVTAITSYGIRLQYIDGSSSDIDGDLNSSFGEFAGDTRVSIYHSFIDSVINGGSAPPPPEGGGACPPAKQDKGKC